MDIKYINPFIESTLNNLEQMAQLKATKLDVTVVKEPKTNADISAVIGLSGEVVGSAVISFPEDIALAISSNVSMRAKLGEQTHNASMVESAIISVMVSYALALSPTPMDRANAADSTADAFVRDITPITSTFRTEISDWI